MASDGVAAVDRALTILDVFKEGDESLTLTEISTRAGLYKSTTMRLAESLAKFGYLRRLEDGAYRLGPKPLYLGSLYQKHFLSADVVPPVLRKIVAELHEGASFYVREGERRVCLHRVDSSRAIRDAIQEGHALPLNVGASGHVLLAFAGQAGQRYEQIRQQLHALSFGERDPETAAVACPVFAVGQRLAGSVTVSGPRYRFADEQVAEMVPVLKKYAAELTRALGGRWPAD